LKKLYTVVALAPAVLVFAAGSLIPVDQPAPSFVLEPKMTGTLAKEPAEKASTGRVRRKSSSIMGAKA